MKKGNITFNWPLVGNKHITEFLEKIILKNETSGTYIFNGPDNLGKTTLAVHFAKSLLCQNTAGGALPCMACSSCRRFILGKSENTDNQMEIGETHGDYHVIKKDKDKKNISIEQVREFISTLSMSSFLNSYKIGIIKHAENLSDQAANALLKTLEEPRDKVVLILITSDIDQLPQTIVSRSKVLNFRPVKTDIIYDFLVKEKKVSRSQAKNFSHLSLGRPALAIKFFENQDFYDNYCQRAEIYLNFPEQNINERFAAIQSLIDDKLSNQENAKQALRILEIWQGLVRDLVLIDFGRPELVQHHLFEEKMTKIKNRIGLKDLIGLKNALLQAKENISANVNTRLVLENIATYL